VGLPDRVGDRPSLRHPSSHARIRPEQNVQSVRPAVLPNSDAARDGLQVQTTSLDAGRAPLRLQLRLHFQADVPQTADTDEAELDHDQGGCLRGQRSGDDPAVDRIGAGFGHSRRIARRGRSEAQRSQERFLLQRGMKTLYEVLLLVLI